MNSSSEFLSAKSSVSSTPAGGAPDEVDATLRLIAKLPPPAGLEDRVFTSLLAAPRGARILAWPRPLHARDWMRSAAAAAIVLVVGGGGWGIYSHVQKSETARAIAAPRVVMQQGGFSSAGVIRRPQTLNGPVLNKQAESSQPKRNPRPKSKEKETGKSSAASDFDHVHSNAKVKPMAQQTPKTPK